VTDFLIRLEQHIVLLELRRLEMSFEKFEVRPRELAEQDILH
jgi:hypothetical protein